MSRRSALGRLGLLAAALALPVLAGCPAGPTTGPGGTQTTPPATGPGGATKPAGNGGAEPIKPPKHDPPPGG